MADNEYEVEAILNHKRSKNNINYFVKWLGYPDSENSWLSTDNMGACHDLLQEYNALHGIPGGKLRGRPIGSKNGGRYANYSKGVKKTPKKRRTSSKKEEKDEPVEEEEEETALPPPKRKVGRPKKVHGNTGKKPWNAPTSSKVSKPKETAQAPIKQQVEEQEDEEEEAPKGGDKSCTIM